MLHITNYKEKYWSTMLLNHLDRLAVSKIRGLKNNYGRAMAALDQYYNNHAMIIAACMKEIKAYLKSLTGIMKSWWPKRCA